MIAFPFDSRIVGYEDNGMPIYDRASDAEHFSRLLASFLSNGVFGSGMCKVSAAGGMETRVEVGDALINGRYAYVNEPETLTHAASEGLPRIDTVVLRLNLSSDVNYIETGIVKGKASSSPSAPALTRDGTVWELGLANVRVKENATSISQTNISDTRLNSSRCGLVYAIRTDIDTESLFAEFDGLLSEMRDSIQNAYDGVELVNVNQFTGTLLASGWSGEGPYTQTITANGVLGADKPKVDVDLTNAFTLDELEELNDAWGGILKATPTTNGVVFYFGSIPEIDIPVKIEVIR